jgi:hypothetical protein
MNAFWLSSLNAIAICLYLGSLIFGAVNMVKFRKHRTFATGLFYTTASFSILVRINYYIMQFYWKDENALLFFAILPDYLVVSVAAS